MDYANVLDSFFKRSNQEVFIEAEGKPSVIHNFIKQYNSKIGRASCRERVS